MSCNNALKIRGFVFRSEEQKLLKNVPVRITVEEMVEGEHTISKSRMLSTNERGYFSFSELNGLVRNITRIRIDLVDIPEVEPQEFRPGQLQERQFIQIEIPGAVKLPFWQFVTGLPAIEFPDSIDYTVSGDILAQNDDAAVGGNFCKKLLPNADLKTFFELDQIVFTEEEGVATWTKKTPYCDPKIDFLKQDPQYKEELNIRGGESLNYEVSWCFLGHSLGKVINSFSLAPCETIRIATFDWRRKELLQREEQTNLSERLAFESRQDRAIDETMNYLNNTGSIGASIFGSGTIKKVFSIGGKISGQLSRQRLAIDSVQNIVNTVQQGSAAQRNLTTTMVVAADQYESEYAQTRGIRNHNKCHTLNLFYYSLVEHYEVRTKYLGKRDLLLVQYCVEKLLPEKIAANAHIFRDNLLDPGLRDCFDKFIKGYFCCAEETLEPREGSPTGGTGGTSSDGKDGPLTNALNVRIRIGKDKPGNNGEITINLQLANGNVISKKFPHSGSWSKNTTYTNTITFSPAVNPADIKKVGLSFQSSGLNNDFMLDEFVVQYRLLSNGSLHKVYENLSLNDLRVQEGNPFWQNVSPELPKESSVIPEIPDETPGASNGKDDCEEALCCAKIILNHFEQNEMYYNGLLWLNEDPIKRGIRFDSYTYNGELLIKQIYNVPVGVIGNWVAFEKMGSELSNPDPVPDACKVVMLPSKGYFMEALLGQCSSCEIVDPDSNEYRPEDCGDPAPVINALTLATPESNNNLATINPTALPSTSLLAIKDLDDLPAPGIIGSLDKILKEGKPLDLTNLDKLGDLLKNVAGSAGENDKSNSFAEKIEKLGDLKSSGLIDQTQYDAAVNGIMEDLNGPSTPDNTLTEKVKELKQLLDDNAINQAQYDRAVNEIMGLEDDAEAGDNSLTARIQELKQLLNDGLITQSQYDTAVAGLIDALGGGN